MNNNIQIEIPIAWEYVRTVRQQVESALATYPEELRSSAVMVASELVENAIKYGAAVPGLEWARFLFETTPEYIQIQVANGLTDPTSLEFVMSTVQQLHTVGSSEKLYMARLQELVNNPVQTNRLGLYRIGHEGKFTLECSYADQILTMTARRHMS